MNFFIDSSVIIEALKREGLKKARIIMDLLTANNIVPFINFIVINEVIYVLCFKKKLMEFDEILEFLFNFERLNITKQTEDLAIDYMKNYNLKPNDALILATCKHYGIPYLISLDEDFKTACEREGIVLIDDVDKLKEVFK